MTDYIDVVEHNPIVFVKSITEAIAAGYSVRNTIQGYPDFGLYGCRVRLFKDAPRGHTVISDDHNGKVEQYDPMLFLMLLESFVVAGYKFKDDGQHLLQPDGLKSVELELVQDKPTTPAKKAAPKKALKAEPTIDELEV